MDVYLARFHKPVNDCHVKNRSGTARPGPYSLLPLLLLLLLALLSNTAGAAWKITDFEIVEGFPDWDEVYLSEGTYSEVESGKEIPLPPEEYINEHADWEEHKIGAGNVEWTRKSLKKIAQQFSKFGLPEPTHLQKSEDGTRYRIYFYDFDVSAYDLRALDHDTDAVGGRSNTNCMTKEDPDEDQEMTEEEEAKAAAMTEEDKAWAAKNNSNPSWIAMNSTRVFPLGSEALPHHKQLLFDSLSHELFHAVQSAAYYAQSGGTGYCAGETLWSEGTASAVGIYMANTVYPDYLTSKSRIGDSKQGRFNFRESWLTAERALGADDRSRDVYSINPIFRYAMERFVGPNAGGEHFMGLAVAKEYLDDLDKLNKLDSWMNTRLENINEEMPLSLYFPEFLAHHAASADRYGVKEQAWVDALFDKCIAVELKKGKTWESSKMENNMLQDNAALCVDVKVTGLHAGECLNVTLAVDHKAGSPMDDMDASPAMQMIDRLHLSTPKMGGVLEDGAPGSDCYEHSQTGFKPRCILKPLTSKSPPSSEIVDGRWSRAWFTPQQRATGSTLENRYILSAARYFYGGAPGEQSINLTIGTDTTSITREGNEVKCPSSGVDTSIGVTHPHPVTTPTLGIQSQQFDALPFLVGLGSPDALDPDKKGISSIVLKEYGDYSTDAEVEGKFQFEFRTEKPIPFGSKGKYPAMITGTQLGAAMAIVSNPGDKPSGSIEVIRFDDQLLHVKVSGKYCLRTIQDPYCRDNYTVSGEVTKPLGWAYDRKQKPVAVFTPGMEPYARLFDGMLPKTPVPATFPTTTPSGGNASAPSDSSAADAASSSAADAAASAINSSQQSTCDCSCAEKDRLAEKLDTFKDANTGEDMPDLSSLPMQAMTCMMQCMMQFAACEND